LTLSSTCQCLLKVISTGWDFLNRMGVWLLWWGSIWRKPKMYITLMLPHFDHIFNPAILNQKTWIEYKDLRQYGRITKVLLLKFLFLLTLRIKTDILSIVSMRMKISGWFRRINLIKTVSKSTLFAVIPDSSLISNAVRDHVMHETLTEAKQQINFSSKFSLSDKSTVFNSETEKTILKAI